MARRSAPSNAEVGGELAPRLPKGGVDRLSVGQSFAEYDPALRDPEIYVHTPAYAAASDSASGKYFYVGRRGTGKTALRRYCNERLDHTIVLVPEIFSPSSSLLELDLFQNSAKRPFRSLVSAFRRALQDEILVKWFRTNSNRHLDVSDVIYEELDSFGSLDFDTRCLQFISRISRPLAIADDEAWLAENKIARRIADAMKAAQPSAAPEYTILTDSIDDFWEGSEYSIIYLTAFMHACLEMSTQVPWARALLFLRENIFERVRATDAESSRLETAVVGMDWTSEQLLEMVERRLNRPFNTRFALGGPTWDAWFERPDAAREEIFDYCQRRPRDVLIYVSNVIESAQAHKRPKLMLEDILGARRRFSDNRIKDLGDEYAENYPQIAIVLARFYGLGRKFTIGGMESFIRKLQADNEVQKLCGTWIYERTTSVEVFIRLLYNIGFIGIVGPGRPPKFRSLGPQDTSPPPLSDVVDLVVHRSYWDALDLQDVLVRSLPDSTEFGRIGFISDLPGGVDPARYSDQLDGLYERLASIPRGAGAGAMEFEDAVGDVIKLCFFRALENVEERVRDSDGRVIRDWVASNRAQNGFWETVRIRYGATQVVWECKNYDDLKADDFHQSAYYMDDAIGRFVVLAFRGREISPAAYGHIRRVMQDRSGLVLVLTERDLRTFVRQAKNGKLKEDHIQDRYDAILRKIS
jgi:hypothetical protein